MKIILSGQASKFLVALGSAAMTALTSFYGTATWEPMVSGLIGALLVYLVPNQQPPSKP